MCTYGHTRTYVNNGGPVRHEGPEKLCLAGVGGGGRAHEQRRRVAGGEARLGQVLPYGARPTNHQYPAPAAATRHARSLAS